MTGTRPGRSPTPADWRRRASLAFGIAVIALLFIVETVAAHRRAPHPASPWIWSVLAVVGVVSLGAGFACRRRAAAVPGVDGPATGEAGTPDRDPG